MKARLATANLLADLVNQGYVSGLAIEAVQHALIIAYQDGVIDVMVERIHELAKAKAETSKRVETASNVALLRPQAS